MTTGKMADGRVGKSEADPKKISKELSKEIASKETDDEKKKMVADGGIDLNELNAALSKDNIKPSAMVTEKFKELDTNKNGKLEKSEVSSENEGGEDYQLTFLETLLVGVITAIVGAIATVECEKHCP